MTSMDCTDCGGVVDFPDDCLVDEIISCPDCGLDYVVVEEESGLLTIKELTLEGEDWGE
jgi:alpha-aminoadipate carrier protein LysW